MDVKTLQAIAHAGGWFTRSLAYAIETGAGDPASAEVRDLGRGPLKRWLKDREKETVRRRDRLIAGSVDGRDMNGARRQ